MTERFTTEGMTLLAIHDKYRRGFYVASVPQFLGDYERNTAFEELGLEPDDLELFEIGHWKSAEGGVAFAYVPFPRRN